MTAEGVSPARPLLLVLAYLPLLGLIPLALGKRDGGDASDREVRWHALNGNLLFAAAIAAALLATLVGIAVPSFSALLYAVVMVVVLCLYVGISLLALVMALTRQRLMIPGISRRASRLAAH